MSVRDRAKSEHAKNAIFVWCICGVIYLLLGKVNGIPPFLIYFIAGIFIASFASIITFLLHHFLWKFANTGLGSLTFFIVDIGWIIFVSFYFLRFINNFF